MSEVHFLSVAAKTDPTKPKSGLHFLVVVTIYTARPVQIRQQVYSDRVQVPGLQEHSEHTLH